jgi:hypothetical protein
MCGIFGFIGNQRRFITSLDFVNPDEVYLAYIQPLYLLSFLTPPYHPYCGGEAVRRGGKVFNFSRVFLQICNIKSSFEFRRLILHPVYFLLYGVSKHYILLK